jgi:hypothetical protein
MGVSNLLDLLQLPTFTHFRGEGGDGGAVVDSLITLLHIHLPHDHFLDL